MKNKKGFLKYLFVLIWLGLTVSLALWWMVFSIRLLDKMATLAHTLPEEFARHKTMLLLEGGFWVFLLVAGATMLMYFIWAERKQKESLQKFVASFSHDLRTSMASLRLQAESLQEDMAGQENPLLERMIGDTVRLDLQLDNSLQVARGENKMLIEGLSLKSVLDSMAAHWPHLKVELNHDGIIQGDIRALENIFKNLIQNSVVHGKASTVYVEVVARGTDRLSVIVKDDGVGFSGDLKRLGKIFYRHTQNSGSGVGLHIVQENIHLLNGRVNYRIMDENKFSVELEFMGALP